MLRKTLEIRGSGQLQTLTENSKSKPNALLQAKDKHITFKVKIKKMPEPNLTQANALILFFPIKVILYHRSDDLLAILKRVRQKNVVKKRFWKFVVLVNHKH